MADRRVVGFKAYGQQDLGLEGLIEEDLKVRFPHCRILKKLYGGTDLVSLLSVSLRLTVSARDTLQQPNQKSATACPPKLPGLLTFYRMDLCVLQVTAQEQCSESS